MKSMVRTRSGILLQIIRNQGCGRRFDQAGHQFAPLVGIVFERKAFGVRCKEKVEGIQHRISATTSTSIFSSRVFVGKDQSGEVIRLPDPAAQ